MVFKPDDSQAEAVLTLLQTLVDDPVGDVVPTTARSRGLVLCLDASCMNVCNSTGLTTERNSHDYVPARMVFGG